jgi:hypothetical protein
MNHDISIIEAGCIGRIESEMIDMGFTSMTSILYKDKLEIINFVIENFNKDLSGKTEEELINI